MQKGNEFEYCIEFSESGMLESVPSKGWIVIIYTVK